MATASHPIRRSRLRTLAVTVIAVAAEAHAATPPGVRCEAKKLVRVGLAARSILRCHAVAAGTGRGVEVGCVGDARADLLARFAQLDATQTCETGDGQTVANDVDTFVGEIVSLLRRQPAASACVAAKLRATATHARDLLKAIAKGELTSDATRYQDGRSRASSRLLAAFSAAEQGADCQTVDDQATVAQTVYYDLGIRVTRRFFHTCGNNVVGPAEECDLFSTAACPGACKSDCTCKTCGDGVVNQPSEQCDRFAPGPCPGLCLADCTCPPPVCGNGVKETGEQCDGADSTACPGLCQGDCTCPPPVCGNGVVESGEECDGATCPTADPLFGPHGCLPAGASLECDCCAIENELCYIQDAGAVMIPCCPGLHCVIGPTAPHNTGRCLPACSQQAD